MRSTWFGSLVALVALSLSGLAYAAWSGSLHVEGTITTATIDASWDELVAVDPIININLPPGQEPPVPDLIQCEITLEPNGADRIIRLSIINGFPNAGCQVTIAGTVRSSIPVVLNGIQTAATDAAGLDVLGVEIRVDADALNRLPDPAPGEIACDGDSPLTPDQILMDGDGFCGVILFVVLPQAKMRSTYSASGQIDLAQWNLAGG